MKLVYQENGDQRVSISAVTLIMAVLVVVCIVIPAGVFWIGFGDAELVQKSILAGSVIAAIGFGIVFGRSLPTRRPLRIRRRQRIGRHS